MILVSKNLYRGPKPDDYADLQARGIKICVELEMGHHNRLHKNKIEDQNPADYGITVIRIPCSNFLPPTTKQVREFLRIVEEALKNGIKVYVHCLHGKDRTGFMVAIYRLSVCGWTPADAVKEMFEHKFHKFPYLWWVHFIYRYYANM